MTLTQQVESLQNLLVAVATGGAGDNADDTNQRQALLSQRQLEALTPSFVRTCRDLGQFWQFIKFKFPTYKERRDFIWGEFRPLFDKLEGVGVAPSDELVTGALKTFDSAHVHEAWLKALDRRTTDPEGAITMARTLLESVCKHILEGARVVADDSPDLTKLYRQTAEQLNLAPSQHTEQVFKQILGGCTSVVEGLGALRNRLSDAHGKTKAGARPASRHAELAVNLSGALASYLLATWQTRSAQD